MLQKLGLLILQVQVSTVAKQVTFHIQVFSAASVLVRMKQKPQFSVTCAKKEKYTTQIRTVAGALVSY